MKPDFYTKTILTIVAICLIALTIKNYSFVPSAKASEIKSNYAMIPVNADGSINVKFSKSDVLDVNIDEVDGYTPYEGTIKVQVEQ